MNFINLMILVEATGEIEEGILNCRKHLEPRISDKDSFLLDFYNYAWDCLLDFKKDQETPKLDPVTIFQQVCPNAVIKDKIRKVRELKKELTTQITSFLYQEALRRDPFIPNYALAEVFLALGLDKRFFKAIEEAFENILPTPEAKQHWALAQLHLATYWHPRSDQHYEDKVFKHLTEGIHHLDIYYAIEKLKGAIEILIRRAFKNKGDGTFSEENLRHYLKAFEPLRKIPLVDILMNGVIFYLSHCPNHYETFETSYLKHFDILRSAQKHHPPFFDQWNCLNQCIWWPPSEVFFLV